MSVATKYTPNQSDRTDYNEEPIKRVWTQATAIVSINAVTLGAPVDQLTALDWARLAFKTKNTNDLWAALYRIPDGTTNGVTAISNAGELEDYRLTEYIQVGGSSAEAITTFHDLTLLVNSKGWIPTLQTGEKLVLLLLTRTLDEGSDSSSDFDDSYVYSLGTPAQLAGVFVEWGQRPVL